ARQLPGHRWRREPRSRRGRVPPGALRQEGARHPRERVRGDQSLRLGGTGRRSGRARSAGPGSAGRATRRHQRGGGPAHPRGERPADSHGRHTLGSRREGRGGAADGDRHDTEARMSILLDEKTRVIVQGFTGDKGTFHAREMIAYGTNVVGGVTPGKGSSEHLGRPVFNTVKEAVANTGAAASLILVPAPFCADAIMEAADAGIRLVVTITDGVPAQDMMR